MGGQVRLRYQSELYEFIEKTLETKEVDRAKGIGSHVQWLESRSPLGPSLDPSMPPFEAGQTSFLNIKERGGNNDFDPHDVLVTL